MVAALGDGVGQLAVEQPRGDQAAAIVGPDRVERGDVRLAMAEGDRPFGIFARRLDQPVALRRVLGDDRHALGLQPFENLRLGVGDRFHRAEIFDVGRGDAW